MDSCIVRVFLFLLLLHDGHTYDLLLFRSGDESVAPDELEPAAHQARARDNRTERAPGNSSDARPRARRPVGTCYDCNMVDAGGRQILDIPADSLCHDAFATSDWQMSRMAHYFRVHCYYRRGPTWETKFETNKMNRYDRNPMRGLYGNFMGGCFKRYLDVGKAYTVRGCRLYRPTHWAGGYAADRFRFLELTLRGRSDACVASPHASLTPFSRGVSLYARYHVCVCSGRYCNQAPPSPPSPSPALLLIYILVASRLCFCCFILVVAAYPGSQTAPQARRLGDVAAYISW